MNQRAFEEIEHTADWALHIRGRDLATLLVNAAQGMNSLLTANLEEIPFDVEEEIELSAFDREALLVAWLSELAYWSEMEGVVFDEFVLHEATPTHLCATVRGGRMERTQKQIKAVTYHNLQIIETEAGLEATVVFDV
jgi:SHS2 domain-containing protein